MQPRVLGQIYRRELLIVSDYAHSENHISQLPVSSRAPRRAAAGHAAVGGDQAHDFVASVSRPVLDGGFVREFPTNLLHGSQLVAQPDRRVDRLEPFCDLVAGRDVGHAVAFTRGISVNAERDSDGGFDQDMSEAGVDVHGGHRLERRGESDDAGHGWLRGEGKRSKGICARRWDAFHVDARCSMIGDIAFISSRRYEAQRVPATHPSDRGREHRQQWSCAGLRCGGGHRSRCRQRPTEAAGCSPSLH